MLLDAESDDQPDTVIESALTPDLPGEELDEEAQSGVSAEILLEEAPPSDELIAALEADNQASVRNAVEPSEKTDELVSDLEEPIVSDLSDDAFELDDSDSDILGPDTFESRSGTSDIAERVESAIIPDDPASEDLAGEDLASEDLASETAGIISEIPSGGIPVGEIIEPTDTVSIDDSDITDYPVQESLTEDLLVRDFATLEDSIGNLPATGVEDLLSDDAELLSSLGQPGVSEPSLSGDEFDLFEMSPTEEDLLVEDLIVEDLIVEDESAEDELAEELIEDPLGDVSLLGAGLSAASISAASLLTDSAEQLDSTELDSSSWIVPSWIA